MAGPRPFQARLALHSLRPAAVGNSLTEVFGFLNFSEFLILLFWVLEQCGCMVSVAIVYYLLSGGDPEPKLQIVLSSLTPHKNAR